MSLQEQLVEDMKVALRGGDTVTLSTIRLLRAALKNAEIEVGHSLNDDEVAAIIGREIKRRRESIELYRQGSREDLVAKETAELAVLQAYQPEQLSPEAIAALAQQVIQATGATSLRDLGRVMGALMPQVKGQADGRVVQATVRELLAQEGT